MTVLATKWCDQKTTGCTASRENGRTPGQGGRTGESSTQSPGPAHFAGVGSVLLRAARICSINT
ncbi:MAG: hypothetical protein ACK559_02955 [bacterium]